MTKNFINTHKKPEPLTAVWQYGGFLVAETVSSRKNFYISRNILARFAATTARPRKVSRQFTEPKKPHKNMKSRFLFILIIVFSNPIFSQEKKEVIKGDELTVETPQNGKIVNGVYICNLFDWKIEIPQGYVITDIKRIEELEKKGFEASKNEVPKGMQIRHNPPHLIGFEIDKRNNFSSSFETLEGTKKMTLKEHKNFVAKLLSDTYSKVEALKFDLSMSDLKIGKYDFYKIQVRLYYAKTDELLLTQEYYSSYITNHLFSTVMNYTNENVGMLLTYNFLKSF